MFNHYPILFPFHKALPDTLVAGKPVPSSHINIVATPDYFFSKCSQPVKDATKKSPPLPWQKTVQALSFLCAKFLFNTWWPKDGQELITVLTTQSNGTARSFHITTQRPMSVKQSFAWNRYEHIKWIYCTHCILWKNDIVAMGCQAYINTKRLMNVT